jgi:cell division protein FtsN
VVFPTPNQNGSPPATASVAPPDVPPGAVNGTMPNNEPRKVKIIPVKGDAAENGGAPVPAAAPAAAAKPAPAARSAAAPATAAPRNPSSANASANAPLSLTPGAPQPDPVSTTRVASTNPAPVASGGGYIVQVSSQKTEAEAQASYRSLQSKYPGVLGSQALVVKRVDLEKGVYYRAFAGPFSSADQATQVCNNLKAAGGPQCLIQRN